MFILKLESFQWNIFMKEKKEEEAGIMNSETVNSEQVL